MKSRNVLALASVLALAAATLGCSRTGDRPQLGLVSGVVTLDGQPAPGLGISFQPQGLRPSLGYTDENGRYELTYIRDIKGAAVGMHEVKIGRIAQTEGAPINKLPARYNNETELSREVEPGKNVFNFDLTNQ